MDEIIERVIRFDVIDLIVGLIFVKIKQSRFKMMSGHISSPTK